MAPLSLQATLALLNCVSLVRTAQSWPKVSVLLYQYVLANLERSQITPSAAHSIQKRAVTNPGPAGWTSIGCYT